jgi:hypothetical protein
MLISAQRQITTLATEHHLPAMHEMREFVVLDGYSIRRELG